jgi:hypothetical protein
MGPTLLLVFDPSTTRRLDRPTIRCGSRWASKPIPIAPGVLLFKRLFKRRRSVSVRGRPASDRPDSDLRMRSQADRSHLTESRMRRNVTVVGQEKHHPGRARSGQDGRLGDLVESRPHSHRIDLAPQTALDRSRERRPRDGPALSR